MTSAKPSNGFVKLDHELVRGETFTGLSSNATRLLIAIVDQYNGSNNGSIRYGNAQATRWLHCGTTTAVRTFAELQAAGLIEVTERASFTNKAGAQKGLATAWRLSFKKPNQPPPKIQTTAPEMAPRGS